MHLLSLEGLLLLRLLLLLLLLLERRLLAKRRLAYLRWLHWEFLSLSHLCHLLMLLSDLLMVHSSVRLLLLDNWLLEDRLRLLDFFPHLDVFLCLTFLVFSPLLNLIIFSCNKLVTQEVKDALRATFDHLSADALHWVTFDIDR